MPYSKRRLSLTTRSTKVASSGLEARPERALCPSMHAPGAAYVLLQAAETSAGYTLSGRASSADKEANARPVSESLPGALPALSYSSDRP